jgi:hypothetical protein
MPSGKANQSSNKAHRCKLKQYWGTSLVLLCGKYVEKRQKPLLDKIFLMGFGFV